MRNTEQNTVKLNNGVNMPAIGFGTYLLTSQDVVETSLMWALEAGYRSIDTASFYNNEHLIGPVLKKSGLNREDLFITSKIWNTEQRSGKIREAFYRSLEKLDCSYLDLYLIHWPIEGYFQETWNQLTRLYEEGIVKALGVSNFTITYLEELTSVSNIRPALNQVEFHPYFQQKGLVEYCRDRDIQIEAWRPLIHGEVETLEEIQNIAREKGKTLAQVILRWCYQNKIIAIPKSSRKEHIFENIQIFDFELTPEEMKLIYDLDRGYRTGPDPASQDF